MHQTDAWGREDVPPRVPFSAVVEEEEAVSPSHYSGGEAALLVAPSGVVGEGVSAAPGEERDVQSEGEPSSRQQPFCL
jgi:hypothetical protein